MEENKSELKHDDRLQRVGVRAMVASVVLGVAAIGLAVALILVSNKSKDEGYTVSFAQSTISSEFEGADSIRVAPGTRFGEINKPVVRKNSYALLGWQFNDADPTSDDIIKDDYQILSDIIVKPYLVMDTAENSDNIFSYLEDQKQWGVLADEDDTLLKFKTEIGGEKSYPKAEFNYYISIGARVNAIPDNFLAGCTNFNRAFVIPSSINTVGNNFMKGCTAFNSPIVIPDNVFVIGDGFMEGCTSFNKDIYFSWDLYKIGNNFMKGCTSFDSYVKFPKEVSGYAAHLFHIGDNFMEGCTSFTGETYAYDTKTNVTIHLPQSLTHIGGGFLYNCDNFTGTIDIRYLKLNILETAEHEELSFANDSNAKPQYATGINILGDNKSEFMKRFKNSKDSAPYRNLL